MMPPFSPVVLAWLEGHAIDPAVAVKVGVQDDHDCLSFPIVTRTGERFTRTRRLPGPCLQPRGVSLAPWWITGHRQAEHALIVEGEGDALAALTARVKSPRDSTIHRLAIVALPGAGVAHPVLVEDLILHGVKAVALALDGDQAGREATHKLGDRITGAGIKALTIEIPDGLDLAEVLARSNDAPATFSGLISGAEHFIPSEPPRPTRKTALRPRRRPTGDQGEAFDRILAALREIPAVEYLPVLAGVEPLPGGRVKCPLTDHEDRNPSAHIHDVTRWWCHSQCQTGGDIFTLAAAITGRSTTGPDFPEVVRWTADQFHIDTAPMERPTERRAA